MRTFSAAVIDMPMRPTDNWWRAWIARHADMRTMVLPIVSSSVVVPLEKKFKTR